MTTTPQSSDQSATMKPERRRSPRKSPEQLAYVDLGADNGGIVLNLSEGGLSFHAAAPVEQFGPFRILFSLEAADQYHATAELAWTEETRRVGGLRFTHLPEDTRELIRNWVVRSLVTFRGLATSVAGPNESSDSRTSEQVVPNAPRQHNVPSSKVRASTLVPTALGLDLPEPEDIVERMPQLGQRPASRSKFIRGFIAGCVVSALLATAFLFHTHRREVSDSLIRFAKRIAPETAPRTAPQVPAAIPASNRSPAAGATSAEKTKTAAAATQETAPQTRSSVPAVTTASNPPSADTKPAEKPKRAGAATEATLNPVAPAPAGHRSRTSQSAKGGESELTAAQQYLRGTKGRRDAAAAAPWLWAAVRKSNTTAEVMLADLYRLGDGVTKGCDQARVLLIAASRRGNVQAMDKLRELNRKGCP